jgi:addiction module RelE/StbE family toxin
MYSIVIESKNTEKRLNEYLLFRYDIKDKLDRLKFEPRRANGAHPLHGKLEGKWSCWLGSNIRLIYLIDDRKQIVIIQAVGSHKIYD